MLNFLLKYFVKYHKNRWDEEKNNAVQYQERIFQELLRRGVHSQFGQEHDFGSIKTYQDWCEKVPLRDYDAFIPYIEKIKAGESDVLFPGKPRYFAKSSGTVAGVKYLPITKTFAQTYAKSGVAMLCTYADATKNYRLLLSPRLLIQGSPILTNINGVLTGRMSGISYHLVPKVLKPTQKPSYETNIIADWEEKVRRIAEETGKMDLSIVAGIPPWVMMYFDELLSQKKKKTIAEVFPNLKLYIHGGVNFEPYRQLVYEKIGKKIDTLDTYTASEGFMGFQETVDELGMTLCPNNGIFYEFVPIEEVKKTNSHDLPTRLRLADIELNRDYALVLNSMSGLWSYLIGDTVRFVDKKPYRFVITGRVAEFTSLFGEHIIEAEVRAAIQEAIQQLDIRVKYFTVAPFLSPQHGCSHHQWWIEFQKPPKNMADLEQLLNQSLCRQNPYYKDLIDGKILEPARVIAVREAGFNQCLYESGKIDGQNKVPLLSNNRRLADALEHFK
ncbi:MAG: hypothetical protein RL757_3247 [Bacteroidota bacterium]|jgi:hypothetical protein